MVGPSDYGSGNVRTYYAAAWAPGEPTGIWIATPTGCPLIRPGRNRDIPCTAIDGRPRLSGMTIGRLPNPSRRLFRTLVMRPTAAYPRPLAHRSTVAASGTGRCSAGPNTATRGLSTTPDGTSQLKSQRYGRLPRGRSHGDKTRTSISAATRGQSGSDSDRFGSDGQQYLSVNSANSTVPVANMVTRASGVNVTCLRHRTRPVRNCSAWDHRSQASSTDSHQPTGLFAEHGPVGQSGTSADGRYLYRRGSPGAAMFNCVLLLRCW